METVQIIKEELQRIYSSKTIDVLLPPIVFILAQNIFNLKIALILALTFSIATTLYRFYQGQKFIYAIFGSLGVALAGAYAIYIGNATSYFLPKLITGGFGVFLTFVSLLFKRPLAAYLSHISRGWPLDWFKRNDVRPAYSEVTFVWGLLFIIRLFILYTLFNKGDVYGLLWFSALLGTPATIIVLIITYLYGSARLKNLKGPSVQEFLDNKQPPYHGQSRGF